MNRALALLILAAACGGPGERAAIVVRHPGPGDTVRASDSTWVNGTLGRDEPDGVRLTVNGTAARVHPAGGWIAWVPVRSGPFVFRVRADGGRSVDVPVHVEPASEPDTLPYRSASLRPRGERTVLPGDTIDVAVEARSGWRAVARLGERAGPLVATADVPDTSVRAGPDDDLPAGSPGPSEGRPAPPPGWVALGRTPSTPDGEWTWLRGRIPAGAAASDTLVIVLEREGRRPVRVPAATIRTASAPAPVRVESVRIGADGGRWEEVEIALSGRAPFRIDAALDPARWSVRLHGIETGPEGSASGRFARSVRWAASGSRGYRVEIETRLRRSWGYRVGWRGNRLVVGLRRPPPAATEGDPLAGWTVVVDAGHGAAPGAIGPTGLEEREVTLAIANALADALEERGARIVLTRTETDDGPGLAERTRRAVEAGADLFASVHANALPDGRNPFVPRGPSVHWHHPQSAPLAAAILPDLALRLGNPYGRLERDDFAVLRITEMPAVLVETGWLTLPDEEAEMGTERFRRRAAEGIAAGIEAFARERAAGAP